MLYRLREALARFMMGRYGWDMLGFALWVLYMMLWFINLFTASYVISALMIAVLIYEIFRILSRNTYARRRENEWFEMNYNKVRSFFIRKKRSTHTPKNVRPPKDKDHIFRRCPQCKAELRLLKRRGRHTAICPRCDKRFKVWVLF
jgi:hypothetical protein